MTSALEGIRVVDFSRYMAGPYASVILADFGAEVIKIESLPGGDPSRRTGVAHVDDQSAFYLAWNRGKKSIALDLRNEAGLSIARSLVETADVLIENYRPGVTTDIGIDFEAMSALNPHLVYCSVTGFGRHGPLAQLPATDPLVQGMSGVMSITGEADGSPVLVGFPVADYISATLAAQGILLALRHREISGRGQLVETSLLFGLMSALQPRVATYWATGEEPGRHGSAHNQVVPYQAFETADGWVMAGTSGDSDWPRFCLALDMPELMERDEFRTRAARLEHIDHLVGILKPVFLRHPISHWVERFQEAGALFAPILSVPSALEHPQTRESGMVQNVDHPTLGQIPQFGPPVLLSESPGKVGHAPPLLGQHTVEILRSVGVSEDMILQHLDDGVVWSHPISTQSTQKA